MDVRTELAMIQRPPVEPEAQREIAGTLIGPGVEGLRFGCGTGRKRQAAEAGSAEGAEAKKVRCTSRGPAGDGGRLGGL